MIKISQGSKEFEAESIRSWEGNDGELGARSGLWELGARSGLWEMGARSGLRELGDGSGWKKMGSGEHEARTCRTLILYRIEGSKTLE